jgi:hypothetical protein
MSLYNRNPLEPFTRANSDDVNAETAKIEAAIDQLEQLLTGIVAGTGIPLYTWLAYADSDDGTVNFDHVPGNRSYVGIAVNKLTATPSDFPVDYAWSLIRGSDAPTLRLVASAPRFDFDSKGKASGASEILFTVEATNIATAVAFTATNDSGNAVTLQAVNATQVKLLVADFGAASWVRVVATANGGGVSDSITITANRDSRPISHRGKYRSDVTYAANDAVTYKGSSFLSKHDANLGNTPVDSEEEDTHWSLLARRGDAGDPASTPALFSSTIALSNTSGMVNLRKLAKTAGYTGKGDANITFNVPNGVLITGRNDGGIGIDTGLWPDLEHTITLVLNVNTGGIVRGGGGNGGNGKGKGQRGGGGGDGGDAIFCRTNMTVNIAAGGEVSGGGGGGDGGSSTITGWPNSTYSEAGGGGGGFPNGAGGIGSNGGNAGANGTAVGGGLGGSPGGVNGGGAAQAAATGGAAGYAVRKNGNTVTVNNSGTMNGTAA